MRDSHTVYDYGILGAGCSGLSLALRLVERARSPVRLVLIDPRSDFGRDRTWCYWDVAEHRFSHLVTHRWSRWQVRLNGQWAVHESARYRYCHIPSDAFYREAVSVLNATPGVEFWLETEAGRLAPSRSGVDVQTTRGTVHCRRVFDSRPQPPAKQPTHLLWQHFAGWRVQAESPVFDPSTVTLMDFDVPQNQGLHFFYLLPYTTREALVEATFISSRLHDHETYGQAIERYLEKHFSLGSFKTTGHERGRIPMTAKPQAPCPVPRVHRIGTPGGMVKPSTGYAFLAIQRWSDRMVSQLTTERSPVPPRARPRIASTLDRIFLSFLHRYPERAPDVFLDLFNRVAPDTLVRFLSDTAAPKDYLSVVSAMPTMPFLREAARLVPLTPT